MSKEDKELQTFEEYEQKEKLKHEDSSYTRKRV